MLPTKGRGIVRQSRTLDRSTRRKDKKQCPRLEKKTRAGDKFIKKKEISRLRRHIEVPPVLSERKFPPKKHSQSCNSCQKRFTAGEKRGTVSPIKGESLQRNRKTDSR